MHLSTVITAAVAAAPIAVSAAGKMGYAIGSKLAGIYFGCFHAWPQTDAF